MTHTYVELPVSQATYDEIKKKLIDAGYTETLIDSRAVDMHGIALVVEVEPCAHLGYSFTRHGRCCPHCNKFLMDLGD